ncbi:MAG: YebC/PmpR family DNA-binding transcriptional regulator [Candidatus Binatia bacterium]|nr:YebC/PmpR family DNA-binding transcriptional regulator [Candidatus Binatia bacterium]
MSGHSKWSTIKHKKAAKDAKRGKIFTKLIREITVATRLGNSGDPNFNPRLRTAIIGAKAASMPNDNIERAIKKGTGDAGGAVYEDVVYEGYGPGGVALLVRTLTDNRNRTVADVRGVFTKHGGNMGEAGCVNWMFHRKGVLLVDRAAVEEESLMELALEAGAEDVADSGEVWEITTDPEAFEPVRDSLEKGSIEVNSAEIAMLPENTVKIGGTDAEKLLKLIDALEDNDDVQSVAANADFDEEALAQLGA